jgi:chromosome segregation ATPase
LTVSITSLETKITETKQKLAASEGDRKFLLTELTRLQNEKETLVAQFNSLAALRTQVAKLREEAAVSQRLAWMQMGVYNMRDKKGAERLLATTPASVKPESRLEIELQQNGRGKPVPNSTGTPNDQ